MYPFRPVFKCDKPTVGFRWVAALEDHDQPIG